MTAPTLLFLAALASHRYSMPSSTERLPPTARPATSALRPSARDVGCSLCRASLDTLAPDTTGYWAGVVLTGRGHR